MPKLVDHDSQRRAIAEAAIGVIDASGLEGTRLRDVAAAADVTTGAITHYFDGKDALIAATMDEIVRRILEKQAEDVAVRDLDSLLSAASAYLPIDAETRRQWRVWLAFWGRAISDPDLRARNRAYYAAITERLAGNLQAGLGTVRVDETAARALADAIVAVIDGIGARAVLEPDEWPPERQRATLRLLLEPLIASTDARTGERNA
jgi:TetR/AcrR family transcriptional repressor of bet genes